VSFDGVLARSGSLAVDCRDHRRYICVVFVIPLPSVKKGTLVEKSSKPAAPINYHGRFQLSRASKKNEVGPAWEPPVENYFHWRLF
jgi:hypothetical protein